MRNVILILAALGAFLSAGCKPSSRPDGSSAAGEKKLTIALLPKSKGNQFFVTCERGARKAAEEMGAELLFDGPTNNDPAKQNEIVENWITLGVDVIAAASQNKEGLSTVLK